MKNKLTILQLVQDDLFLPSSSILFDQKSSFEWSWWLLPRMTFGPKQVLYRMDSVEKDLPNIRFWLLDVLPLDFRRQHLILNIVHMQWPLGGILSIWHWTRRRLFWYRSKSSIPIQQRPIVRKINESTYNVVSVQNRIKLVQILWCMNRASLYSYKTPLKVSFGFRMRGSRNMWAI